MAEKIKSNIVDILLITVGSFFYSLAFTVFLNPNYITPGGLTGIAALINYLSRFPIGITVIILNIPVFILGYKKFSLRFVLLSGLATVLTSVFIEVCAFIPYTYTSNRILAAIFGGVLLGIGLALVMLRGATTGGIDILAKLLKIKFPHIMLGRIMLMIDVTIMIMTAIVYKQVEAAMYSIITLFASSKMLDTILYGSEGAKMFFIISENPAEMKRVILGELQRGVTQLDARGGYSEASKKMLVCAVRRYETARLHRIIKEVDPNAFVMIAEAGEIIGEGFSKLM